MGIATAKAIISALLSPIDLGTKSPKSTNTKVEQKVDKRTCSAIVAFLKTPCKKTAMTTEKEPLSISLLNTKVMISSRGWLSNSWTFLPRNIPLCLIFSSEDLLKEKSAVSEAENKPANNKSTTNKIKKPKYSSMEFKNS